MATPKIGNAAERFFNDKAKTAAGLTAQYSGENKRVTFTNPVKTPAGSHYDFDAEVDSADACVEIKSSDEATIILTHKEYQFMKSRTYGVDYFIVVMRHTKTSRKNSSFTPIIASKTQASRARRIKKYCLIVCAN